MIYTIMELIIKAFKRDEKSRKYAVNLADSYLRRIRRFQDQLVLLGVILNFSAVGYMLKFPAGDIYSLRPLLIAAAGVCLTNMLLAKLYSNEHRTTKLLFARYPELELIMVGDKNWSNFKVLASAYKWVQAGWALCSAVLVVFWIGA